MSLTPRHRAFLESVEQSEHWRDADLHWMDLALGDALFQYDVDGEHLAPIFIDFAYKLAEILEEFMPAEEHDDHAQCGLLQELAVLQVQVSIMAAIATREQRGKAPIWTLPIPEIRPGADGHPG